VLLWAAANTREMHVDAQLGLHRAWIDPETPEGMKHRVGAEYEARSLAVLQAAGFSDELLDRRADTANDDMTYFDAAELLDHGVDTIVVDDDGTLLTPRRVREMLGPRAGA